MNEEPNYKYIMNQHSLDPNDKTAEINKYGFVYKKCDIVESCIYLARTFILTTALEFDGCMCYCLCLRSMVKYLHYRCLLWLNSIVKKLNY